MAKIRNRLGEGHVNPYYEPYWLNDEELEHYGVKGMKWKRHVKRRNIPSLSRDKKKTSSSSNNSNTSNGSNAVGYVDSFRENGKMVEYTTYDTNGKITGGGTRPATEDERRMWALRKIDRIEDNVEAVTGSRETAKK